MKLEVIARLVQVSAFSVKQERIARKDRLNVRNALPAIIAMEALLHQCNVLSEPTQR